MLDQYAIGASLPASDLARARGFYEDKLGFSAAEEMSDGGVMYESGGSRFLVYPSGFAGTNQATAAAWEVDDIEAVVSDLRARGIVFEEYDFDELKTVDGIATMPDGQRGGWFKDTEGNILAVFQRG